MEGYYLFFDDRGERTFIDILTLEQIWIKNPNYIISLEDKVFGSMVFVLTSNLLFKNRYYTYKQLLRNSEMFKRFLEEKKKRIQELRNINLKKVINFSLESLNRFGEEYLLKININENNVLELEVVERNYVELTEYFVSREFPVCFKDIRDYDIFIRELISLYPLEEEIIRKKSLKDKSFFLNYVSNF